MSELILSDYCLGALLKAHAQSFSMFPAIKALDQSPLTYAGLFNHARSILSQLNAYGLSPGDRIAVVLPNGPEMATAFVSVAAGATCAPLNPAYRAAEFEFFLTDLNAKAVVVLNGTDSPVLGVADALGIPLLALTPILDNGAGRFTLSDQKTGKELPCANEEPKWAAPDDIAMVLHTSGTTARPKIVPLTQSNLCASGQNIAATLKLTPEDLCLNVMPLFHIHGLVGALLSSLTAASSLYCTTGFSAPHFFEWMAVAQPTWYTAVPTMHQAILARAVQDGARPAASLRFVRSSSAALPPQVMVNLEVLFDAPVLEAYGMTEASHQMACNPLPPLPRKPGSVGLPAGPQIAILDDQGEMRAVGEIGEVAIQGPTVTRGYEGIVTTFTNGWFRTGDQGYFDPDGYLFLTGRLKEQINRGGEKISPREIDEALFDHPAVAQAVTFGAPHAGLGEEVMAAVVLTAAFKTSEPNVVVRELREFVGTRLADFKVPVRIIFLDELPKGPTGKVQRIGLAEKLGVTASDAMLETFESAELVAASTPTEAHIIDLCRDILKRDRISVTDNFFRIGGDSLLAARLMTRISQNLSVEISLVRLFEVPTIRGIAQTITETQAEQDQDAAEMRRLLAELETLTDEEAEKLIDPLGK